MNDENNRISSIPLKPTLLVIAALTGTHWVILAFGIPILDHLPYWKYKHLSTLILPGWILSAFAAFCLAWIVYLSRLKPGMKILLFILLGTAIQHSFAFAKGSGLDGIRDHMVSFGHAEFAKAAVEQPGNMLWVAQQYEEVAAKLKYGYIGSKPPGTLLFYMAYEQVSYAVRPAEDYVERLENLRTFASQTWPLLSYLVLAPLYYLAGEIIEDPQAAMLACLLLLAVPSMTLITLHTDQMLYPLLAVSTTLSGYAAYRKESFWLAVLSGALFYFMVYFSFGLAVIGLFFLTPVLTSMAEGKFAGFGRLARYGGGILFGALLLHIPAAIFLNYNISLRYANAWANHLAWKGWENNPETYLAAGTTNLIEFSVWIGLPLVVCFLAGLSNTIRDLRKRKIDASGYFHLPLAGIFIFLLAFGRTKAEVARLWLFLLPFVCIAVSRFTQNREWSRRDKTIFAAFILLLEFGTTCLTLRFQDFS